MHGWGVGEAEPHKYPPRVAANLSEATEGEPITEKIIKVVAGASLGSLQGDLGLIQRLLGSAQRPAPDACTRQLTNVFLRPGGHKELLKLCLGQACLSLHSQDGWASPNQNQDP